MCMLHNYGAHDLNYCSPKSCATSSVQGLMPGSSQSFVCVCTCVCGGGGGGGGFPTSTATMYMEGHLRDSWSLFLLLTLLWVT